MSDAPISAGRDAERAVGGHSQRHGRRSSWTLVSVIVAAFVAGGIALIVQLWWLFWVSAAIVVLSVPAGKLVRIMDDTMIAESPGDRRPVAADRGSAADPGVRVE